MDAASRRAPPGLPGARSRALSARALLGAGACRGGAHTRAAAPVAGVQGQGQHAAAGQPGQPANAAGPAAVQQPHAPVACARAPGLGTGARRRLARRGRAAGPAAPCPVSRASRPGQATTAVMFASCWSAILPARAAARAQPQARALPAPCAARGCAPARSAGKSPAPPRSSASSAASRASLSVSPPSPTAAASCSIFRYTICGPACSQRAGRRAAGTQAPRTRLHERRALLQLAVDIQQASLLLQRIQRCARARPGTGAGGAAVADRGGRQAPAHLHQSRSRRGTAAQAAGPVRPGPSLPWPPSRCQPPLLHDCLTHGLSRRLRAKFAGQCCPRACPSCACIDAM